MTVKTPEAPVAGAASLKLFNEEQEYMTPGLQQIATFSKLAMEKGRGAILTDVDGKEYIDFIAGVCVASIGHGHPEFARALAEQAASLSVGSFTTKNRVEFLRRLTRLTPEGLNKVQLYSSGAEAVEAALRLARSHTKKFEVVSFWGGFHGKTGGVLGLLGSDFKHQLGPLAPGLYLSPYPNPYRNPFGIQDEGKLSALCLEFLRQKLKHETSGALAAIILEPIQGTAGNVIPPAGFLKGLKELAREFGALLIADEMITGFGRTGKWFGVQHDGVLPDIMTVGKGVAGGFPVSGLITTAEIASAKPFANPSGSSSSYGGNPLAAAACNATLRILETENLVENSRAVGQAMLMRLERLKARFNFIGDVRGRGLMIGIELVKDRKTREPLSKEICRAIFDAALRRGLITMAYSASMRINPPLNITAAQAERGIDVLEDALKSVAEEFGL
ncbi:MAG TPA: aspartate aminotransferase family protein [Elusimicrobiota bacterium]|nr:aspartate aminotransferase family protein [Elusimicrobiota bacterium]